MLRQKDEYYGSATNTHACFSNIVDYGCHAHTSKIIVPTPVTYKARLFENMKPHPMPRQTIIHTPRVCNTYNTMAIYPQANSWN